jgi:signal transduction histidine kinase
MRWSLESKAILTGTLVLALLLVIGLAQYATIHDLVASLQMVTHTVSVGEQLGTVQDAVSRTGAAARRFVTTGDGGDLDAYNSAVENARGSVLVLAAMVADNPVQVARIVQLRPLVERRLAGLDDVVTERESGSTAAAGIGELDRVALAQTDAIRLVLDRMRSEEDRLLVERNSEAAANRRRTSAVLALGSLFAVGVVLWGAVALHRDVARRNQMEAALRSSEDALRDLSGRIMRLQDDERRRWARELHDGTSQTLTAIQLRVATLQLTLAPDNERTQASLAELSALIERCSREIRTLSHLLHPPLLEHTGIASAIRWYAEGFTERSGIKVDVQTADDWPRLDPESETALFRVTQEALTNIHRHSGGTTATIKAAVQDGRVVLEIIDDGRGIAPELLESPARFGVGLRGMTERIRLLGGKLSIASGQQGTTVRAELPVTSTGEAGPQPAAGS